MKILWVCNIMLPAYAKAHGIEYSVREGWLTGCLNRLLKEKKPDAAGKITLGIAFPMKETASGSKEVIDKVTYYGFNEDLSHPENYDESLEPRFKEIINDFEPDMIHVFGTEFPHA
ncbi:MAG: glycosyl transferase 4, partial [Butyrivibrio sp.]|nr:glycosyl transferase 4 [Butyrivibrio sp.]